MKTSLIVVFLAAFPPALCAQSVPPDPIPSSEVDFHPSDGGAPLSLPSFAVSQLPVCYSPDSCSLAVVPDPENRARQLPVIFDLSGKSRAVDPAAVESLSYVQVLTSTPTADGVAVLVHAATSGNGTDARLVPKPGVEPDPSKLHDGYFVCFFDRDGGPKGVYPLDSRYDPSRIAYLGGDRLMLLLLDKVRHDPVLGIMTSDGQLVRILDDQGSLPSGDDLAKDSTLKLPDDATEDLKRIAISGTMSTWQVGYAGNRLLFLQPGANPSILEVSPGGGIRKVRLKMPEGTTAGSIISSDRGWLIRCFLVSSQDAGVLLEFDSESGKVLRRIATKGTPPTSIFYAGEGNYYASWWDKDHKRVLILKNK
jgi:hypothetical protein